jgi:hypothetical protein
VDVQPEMSHFCPGGALVEGGESGCSAALGSTYPAHTRVRKWHQNYRWRDVAGTQCAHMRLEKMASEPQQEKYTL